MSRLAAEFRQTGVSMAMKDSSGAHWERCHPDLWRLKMAFEGHLGANAKQLIINDIIHIAGQKEPVSAPASLKHEVRQ
jgi:hypothetical protein